MALEEFAAAMHQEFSPADVLELATDGIFELDGGCWRFRSDVVREVAYQTLTKRTRAQRHAGVAMALAAEKGEYLHQIEDLAHHAATAAELVGELGRVPGVPAPSPVTPCTPCTRRPRPRSTPAVPSTPSAMPAGPSGCARLIRRPSGTCC